MRSNGIYYQPLGRPRHHSKTYTEWRRGLYKLLGILLGVAIVSCILVHTRLERNRGAYENIVKSNYFSGKLLETPVCKLPLLPLDNPEILQHLKKVPPIKCPSTSTKYFQDWVRVNGTHAVLSPSAKQILGNITCKFSGIDRIDDFRIVRSPEEIVSDTFKFETSDFVYVRCASRDEQWQSVLACPRSNVDVRPLRKFSAMENSRFRDAEKVAPLSVIFWGMDSLSRNMFIRRLPKTHEYLIHKLDAIVLKGYNIVGDGTPQALIPILTGSTESELPEVRQRMGDAARNVDVYPFIWRDYAAAGFTTAYLEDSPNIGTFTYRLKGFKQQPTDFYMRPYFMAVQKFLNPSQPYCTGTSPTHQIMMNYIKHILGYRPSRPKFIFSFQGELSHNDNNPVQGQDADLRQFLADLEKSSALNNSILLVFSDHGNRFSEFRLTQQGKQEERMPMFAFVFPRWFKQVYKVAYQNFIRNSYILSSPFDIYPTLNDILRLHNLDPGYFNIPNDVSRRGLSLFRSIPVNRTCRNAGIEAHWCACLQWRTEDVNAPTVRNAASYFVQYLNMKLSNYSGFCAPLRLQRILKAFTLVPKQEMLHFKSSADTDGRLPDMTDTMQASKVTLQLAVETVPGNGRFEVSMAYNVKKDVFKIQDSDISRVNKYGEQAWCLADKHEHVQKFCFCDKGRT